MLVLTVRSILSSLAPSQTLILARGGGGEERKAEGADPHLARHGPDCVPHRGGRGDTRCER